MSSNFGFTSLSSLGNLVKQAQQAASQVSNQFSEIDSGIKDVASNIEHAFTGSSSSTSGPDNTLNQEPYNNSSYNSRCDNSSSSQNAGIPSSSGSSKRGKTTLEEERSTGETVQINSSSTSTASARNHKASQATAPDLEDDFVYIEKPNSDEVNYQFTSPSSSQSAGSKASKLSLSGLPGFGNPFGYLMGNGGLCGASRVSRTAGTTASNTFSHPVPSETVTLPASDQQEQLHNNPRSSPATPSSRNNINGRKTDTMYCDKCNTKFGFLTRKKTCSECRLYFCSNCVSPISTKHRDGNESPTVLRVCARCRVLLNYPPVRADLMELRVKDLQRHLMSKQISMKDCVEKKDLVELVIKENSGASLSQNTTTQPGTQSADKDDKSTAGGTRSSQPPAAKTNTARNVGPVERQQQNFPRSYIQSTHRQDFFEKFIAEAEAEGDQHVRQMQQRPTSSWVSESENIAPRDITTDLERVDAMKSEQSCRETASSSAEDAKEVADHSFTPIQELGCGNTSPITKSMEEREKGSTWVTPVEPMDTSSAIVSPDIKTRGEDELDKSLNDSEGPISYVDNNRLSDMIGDTSGAEKAPSEDESTTSGDTYLRSKNSSLIDKPGRSDVHGDEATESAEGAVGGAGKRVNVESPLPVSPSLKRFAKQGLVYLSDIDTLGDLNELSGTQIKNILAMNRVNFKGVVEKEELLKIIERLWNQEQKAKSGKDMVRDEELCKICMDSPVDCVMLECGHMCTCTRCGKQMAECPICRQYVIRVVRTFKA